MIKEYRIKNGLSQEQLAEKLNISWRHLQHLEHDESKTTVKTLKKLIKVLKISDKDILKYLNSKDNNDDNDFDAQWFNMKFSEFNGTKSTFFIKGYLDRIVTNNKTEKEHIITVKYLDKETSDSDEIVAIKKSLAENGEYELSMDYDEKGFFNKLTIVE